MRDHVIAELTKIAQKDQRVYLMTGDLGYAVLDDFRKKCPKNYINVGIAEQNMTALAAGMAREGNIVFTYSIGNFPTLRCIEQIRNDVCYHHANVKILAVGGGMVYGNQGITHHATEDIAMMRAIPNMRVYVPGDAYEAVQCLKEAYETNGPAYIRLSRNKEEVFHDENEKIDINQIVPFGVLGQDVNIFTAGPVLCEGVKLKKLLTEKGYNVGLFSVPRIKPIDNEGIVDAAKHSKLLISMEEHQISGGLGGTISEVISSIVGIHAPLLRTGLHDEFSEQTGSQEYLRDYYGITAEKVSIQVEKFFSDNQ
jgi:Transketolase, C-terminal subunit